MKRSFITGRWITVIRKREQQSHLWHYPSQRAWFPCYYYFTGPFPGIEGAVSKPVPGHYDILHPVAHAPVVECQRR